MCNAMYPRIVTKKKVECTRTITIICTKQNIRVISFTSRQVAGWTKLSRHVAIPQESDIQASNLGPVPDIAAEAVADCDIVIYIVGLRCCNRRRSW